MQTHIRDTGSRARTYTVMKRHSRIYIDIYTETWAQTDIETQPRTIGHADELLKLECGDGDIALDCVNNHGIYISETDIA